MVDIGGVLALPMPPVGSLFSGKQGGGEDDIFDELSQLRYTNLSEHPFSAAEKEFAAKEFLGETTYLNLGSITYAVSVLAKRHNAPSSTMRKWKKRKMEGQRLLGYFGGTLPKIDEEGCRSILAGVEGVQPGEPKLKVEEVNRLMGDAVRGTMIRRNRNKRNKTNMPLVHYHWKNNSE